MFSYETEKDLNLLIIKLNWLRKILNLKPIRMDSEYRTVSSRFQSVHHLDVAPNISAKQGDVFKKICGYQGDIPVPVLN